MTVDPDNRSGDPQGIRRKEDNRKTLNEGRERPNGAAG